MADKKQLRRLARMLSPATDDENRSMVANLAESVPEEATVCLFRPMPGEVDPTGLIDLRVTSQYLTTRTGEDLWLTLHDIDSDMERHRYGYEQPVAGSLGVSPSNVDVFCVPGLAFDEWGGRLGHGMGYYDRLLSLARPDALVVGVTLERRVFPRIPMEDLDVRMHVVVTEQRVIRPRTGPDAA